MEHTRKMVLIPQESINKLKSIENKNENTTLTSIQTPGDPVSRLDNELTKILNSNKNDIEKWREYREVFRRFLFFNNDDDKKQTKFLVKDIVDENVDDFSSYPIENILKSVPQMYRKKAQALINHIKAADTDKRLTWDKSGCIILDNNKIPNTNIVDLINDAIRHRKSHIAIGQKKFARFLQNINAPRDFVGNQNFWRDLSSTSDSDENSEKTLTYSTPVTTPNKRKIHKRFGAQSPTESDDLYVGSRSDSDVQWLSLEKRPKEK